MTEQSRKRPLRHELRVDLRATPPTLSIDGIDFPTGAFAHDGVKVHAESGSVPKVTLELLSTDVEMIQEDGTVLTLRDGNATITGEDRRPVPRPGRNR